MRNRFIFLEKELLNYQIPASYILQKSLESEKRPSWESVYRGYPKKTNGTEDLEANLVFESVWAGNPRNFTNACATRVSLGLLEAGVTDLTASFLVQNGRFKGKPFITSARVLLKWLLKDRRFGVPTVQIDADKSRNGTITLEQVQQEIGRKNGIYLMKPKNPNSFNASGHASLWLAINSNGKGNAMSHANYISDAKSIYFWELI